MKTKEPVAKKETKPAQKSDTGVSAPVPEDGYMALIRLHRLKPIRSHEELDAAITRLNELLVRSKSLTEEEYDYLECLGHEIEYYEEENIPMRRVGPPESIRRLIETRELTASEVARGAGIAVSTLSAILNGKRKLNLDHIARLARYFRLEQAYFVD